MTERKELSAERIQLIRRFMGEPEGEDDRPADRATAPAADDRSRKTTRVEHVPVSSEATRVEHVPAPSETTRLEHVPVPAPLDQDDRIPRFDAMASWRGAARLPGMVVSLRSRFELGWPIAAIVLGLLIGLLIARSV